MLKISLSEPTPVNNLLLRGAPPARWSSESVCLRKTKQASYTTIAKFYFVLQTRYLDSGRLGEQHFFSNPRYHRSAASVTMPSPFSHSFSDASSPLQTTQEFQFTALAQLSVPKATTRLYDIRQSNTTHRATLVFSQAPRGNSPTVIWRPFPPTIPWTTGACTQPTHRTSFINLQPQAGTGNTPTFTTNTILRRLLCKSTYLSLGMLGNGKPPPLCHASAPRPGRQCIVLASLPRASTNARHTPVEGRMTHTQNGERRESAVRSSEKRLAHDEAGGMILQRMVWMMIDD